MRYTAATALAEHSDAGAMVALLDLLQSNDDEVCRAAADGLTRGLRDNAHPLTYVFNVIVQELQTLGLNLLYDRDGGVDRHRFFGRRQRQRTHRPEQPQELHPNARFDVGIARIIGRDR